MKKNELPSIVTDYNEMKLEEWAMRPRQRRSHMVQMGRWTWRVIRNILLALWGINLATLLAMTLLHPEMAQEYRESSRIFGLLLFLTVMISPEAPAWWIEFYQRWV